MNHPTKELLHSEYVENGKTLITLAEQLGISKSSLQRYLSAYGISKRSGNRFNFLTRDFVLREYVENKRSVADIAAERDIDAGTLSTKIKCMGFDVREKWENCESIVGAEFNSLVATNQRRVVIKRGAPRGEILFQCQCGKEKWLERNLVVQNKIKSCGCLRERKKRMAEQRVNGCELSSQMFSKIRIGAKRRNIDFHITLEEVWELFIRQGRKCSLTGHVLRMPTVEHLTPQCNSALDLTGVKYASLDRIDSLRGYHLDNVQWVWAPLNFMKWTLPQSVFISICTDVAKKYSCAS